ncbi:MAG: hypothetical protein Mars2KO_24210 [Maribacter sp.]
MKKFLLFSFLFISFSTLYAQCPDRLISISSQADLDNFKTTYPNCTDLLKNFYLNGSDITDLSGLDEITSVNGSFTIKNTSLVNLSGLGNLSAVDDLTIEDNDNLEQLTGLENLSSIQSLVIKYNDVLGTLNGLSSLSKIDEDLTVTNSPALLDISGLSGLTQVVGNIVIGGARNSNFDGLNQLETVGGDLSLLSLPNLTSLSGFTSLQTIGGVLTLKNHTALQSINGFPSLIQIGGLDIDNNKALDQIQGFISLQTISGDFNLGKYSGSNNTYRFGHDVLTDISGFSSLEMITGDLTIQGNKLLQTLNGLGNLMTVQGNLNLYHNESLQNLNGLDSLTRIDGDFQIIDNDSLIETDALSNLGNVLGDVEIRSNEVLENLSGLNELVHVGGDFEIGGSDILSRNSNDALVRADFIKLQTIGGNFHLINNSILPNISGFNSLESVGALLRIANNSVVDNVSGFNSLTLVGSDITINGIEELSGFQQLQQIPGSLYLCGGETFTSMTGFSQLRTVGSTLSLCSSPALSVLAGFQNLETIQEDFLISNNNYDNNNLVYSSFTDFSGFTKLKSIGGDFKIDRQISLQNFNGLQLLETIGGDFIVETGLLSSDRTSYTSSLTSMLGLSSLLSVGRDMQIQHNSSLPNLDGLQTLKTVERYCTIAYNQNLQNLEGLEALENVDYNFYIRHNDNLEELTGLSSLKTVTNILEIIYNPKLVSLEGLDNLKSFKTLNIGQNPALINLNHLNSLDLEGIENTVISITNNDLITSLAGLEAVTDLNRMVVIGNPELVSLNGLDNVRSLGNLDIEQNHKLQDLSAVENAEIANGGLLRIQFNPMLSECSEKSICNFIRSNDRVSILLNNNGCKTKWEILDRCPNPDDIDGDGVLNSIEVTDGTNPNDGCSYLEVHQDSNLISVVWEEADCDNDGILNGTELSNGSNPRKQDTDGDGVSDGEDSNPIDACIPFQNSNYVGYDAASLVWQGYDCDGDGFLNGDELISGTNPYYDEAFHADSEIPDPWAEQRVDFSGNTPRSIATDGTTVAVGRYGAPSGLVKLYEKNNEGIWEEVQTLIPDSPNIRYGAAVALSGNTLFVGQPYKSESLPDAVIIYEKGNDGVWTEVQQIQSSHDFDYDGFGSALAISENTLVVGANSTAPSGAVFIFEKIGDIWSETGELSTIQDYFNGNFGSAIAISKNQIVVGSPSTEDGGALIFEKQANGSWEEQQRLVSPSGLNRGYGGAVSISGNRVIVGDLSYGELEYGQGQTFVYEKNYDGTWSAVQTMNASNGYDGDYFGDALAMNDNRIVINMSVDQADTGWLYLFHKQAGSWIETHILTDPESSTLDFGYNVAVQGNLIVATSLDHVHFFEPALGDSDGDGIDDTFDVAILDSCLPAQPKDYEAYDASNTVWANADCDGDGILNGDEVTNGTNPYESDLPSSRCDEIVVSDGAASDFFGKVTALSKDEQVLAISSYNDDDLGENSGSVYIFEKDTQGSWVEKQKLNASDGSEDELFGFSMAFAGQTLAISAYRQNNSTGAVYLFDESPAGVWEESQKLLTSDTSLYQQFGYAISGIENRLLIGASKDAENGTNSGAAYIFDKVVTGEWVETKKLIAVDGDSHDSFGISVALAPHTAVISAWYDDDLVENSGAIYIFEQTANEDWSQVTKLKASDASTYSGYGTDVSISEQTIVVGAASNNTNDTSIGSAYVYEKSQGGSWSQTTRLSPTNGMAQDRFGLHVAIDGNRIVCGISGDDENGPSTGALQIFEKSNTGTWNPTLKLSACNDDLNDYANFGHGVTLSSNLIVVGTNLFSDVGSAFVFEIEETSTDEIELTVSKTDVSCNGINDGTVEVQATGGTLPYLFILENPTLGNTSAYRTGQFSNLRAGDYIVTVRDDVGAEASLSISIFETTVINSTVLVEPACKTNASGSLHVETSGGVPPYQYSIDNGLTYGSGNEFTDLPAAEYQLYTRDSNGCISIQSIIVANDENCSQFALPTDNFIIEITGESCATSNNGSILLRAEVNLDYTATVQGMGLDESKEFRTFTNFQDLSAGSYELCVTVAGEADYQKCFTVTITEPETLDVDSSVDPSSKTISLNLKGGARYFINLNGSEYTTSENQLTLPLSKVENTIAVKTDKECQGVYENTFFSTNSSASIYPNPVEKGDVTIELPDDTTDQVLLTVFSENGIRVLEKMEKTENRTVRINMDGLPSGVYTIIITTQAQNSMRKIIKK